LQESFGVNLAARCGPLLITFRDNPGMVRKRPFAFINERIASLIEVRSTQQAHADNFAAEQSASKTSSRGILTAAPEMLYPLFFEVTK